MASKSKNILYLFKVESLWSVIKATTWHMPAHGSVCIFLKWPKMLRAFGKSGGTSKLNDEFIIEQVASEKMKVNGW